MLKDLVKKTDNYKQQIEMDGEKRSGPPTSLKRKDGVVDA